jgi:uncharacterized protein
MLDIYVDADACPVKREVCKVAKRHHLSVVFVSNAWMRIPEGDQVRLVVVDPDRIDAADHWIVEHVSKNDLVVTTDIPLAYRCVQGGAQVLSPTGLGYTEDNIGQMMATRGLLSELRDAGTITGGPPPFQARDRSRFLHNLDQIIQAIQRANT